MIYLYGLSSCIYTNRHGPHVSIFSKRKETVYEIGERVYLRVSPLRGVKRFGVKGKLAPGFVGPYKVLEQMGEVAYKSELPEGCQEFTMCSTFPS